MTPINIPVEECEILDSESKAKTQLGHNRFLISDEPTSSSELKLRLFSQLETDYRSVKKFKRILNTLTAAAIILIGSVAGLSYSSQATASISAMQGSRAVSASGSPTTISITKQTSVRVQVSNSSISTQSSNQSNIRLRTTSSTVNKPSNS